MDSKSRCACTSSHQTSCYAVYV